MNEPPPVIVTAPRFSWRAIIAGAVVALSTHLLLTTLGTGITAFIARPSNSDAPVKALGIGTTVSWTVSALISLWLGAFVAGKVGAAGDRESGRIHGFVMWSVATVVAFLLVIAGAGGAAAGLAGLAGSGVAAVTKTVAEAAPDLAKESKSMIDAYAGEVTVAEKPIAPAAKRQLLSSLKNYLGASEAERTPQKREAVITAVVASGAMPADAAARTVDEWTQSYDNARAELTAAAEAAARKAREAADKAAAATGVVAIWTFIAFWLGAVVAAWGGTIGAEGSLKFRRRGPESPRGLQPAHR